MRRNLVFSPHLDDAVLSMGQHIAGDSDTVVVTIYAGEPAEDPWLWQVTRYDQMCGFNSSVQAVRERQQEDRRAMSALGVDHRHWPWRDAQYNENRTPPFHTEEDHERLVGEMLEAIAELEPDRLFGPLGLLHDDHVNTHNAFVEVVKRSKISSWVYEEVPYRVLEPRYSVNALDRLALHWGLVLDTSLPMGQVEKKERAVRQYRSQDWALDQRCLYVPERVWRLGRPAEVS